MPSSIFVAVLAALGFAGAAGSQPARADELSAVTAADVRALLDASGSPQPLCATAEGRGLWAAVQAFYAERADAPVWLAGPELTPEAGRLTEALRGAADDGLEPARYEPLRLAGGDTRPAALEVGLSAAFALLGSDLARGRVDLRPAGVLWTLARPAFDALALLREAAATGRPDVVLDRARPAHPQYAALREARRRYVRLAALETTAAAPGRERLRAIDLNLERWRAMEHPVAERMILVNIPTFELHAYEGGRAALSMRVIVGKPDAPTPVFSREMSQVVFSPYWNVPASIAADETLPAARRDPAYLRRANLEVLRAGQVVDPRRVDWRRDSARVSLRQRPGAGNALGLVKFLLPNPFGVYLHDTPNHALFRRPERALSHGCVRLDRPEDLARWVLSGAPGWDAVRIRAAMKAGRESTAQPLGPVPVTVAYFTVWVDEDGMVQFPPDVYRHDAAQAPLLQAPDPGR